MVGPRIGQHNFSRGILSKELWGRIDVASYPAGVRQARNVVILKFGGMSKRPGSRMVYEIKGDEPRRLIPFEGAYEASYALVMGQASMQVAALGGMVIEERLTVEAATNTDPVTIIASFHGFANGEEVFFADIEGMVELNGKMLPVTVTGPHSFTVPLDGTSFGVFTGDAGGIIRTEVPPPPPPPPSVPEPVPPPPPPPVGGGGWEFERNPIE